MKSQFQILKIIFIFVFIVCNNIMSAESPYALFGDSSKTLEATEMDITELKVIIQPQHHDTVYLNMIPKRGIYVLKDHNGDVIAKVKIPEITKARFLSIDPHAQKYQPLTPYNFCGGNPINIIDPDGKDWHQNNQTSYYTWYDGDKELEGYKHIGGKGSVLGEFEAIIDNILSGEDGLGMESLYSEGFTFDIAPIDKGGLIGSKERDWDFFDEFVFGSGPEFTVITANHPYNQAIQNDEFAKNSQNIVRSRGEEGKYTNAGRPEFFPWQVSLNSPMQFIGTYRYDGYSSKDTNYINNVATDSKSITSLGLYVPFLKNHRRSQNKKLGNTYQFYICKSKR